MKHLKNHLSALQSYFYFLLVASIFLSNFFCNRKTIITPNAEHYLLTIVLPNSDSGSIAAYRDSGHTLLISGQELDSLKLGETIYLKAIPNNGYIVSNWVGVDNGSVSNDKKTASVTISTHIKISVSFRIDIKSSLNKNSTYIELGLTDTLSAIFTSNTLSNLSMNWHSENTTIATVDNHGIITAVGQGITKIIATPSISGINPDTCIVHSNLWDGVTLTPVLSIHNTYFINAASQFAWIANQNNNNPSMNYFKNNTIVLNQNINLNNKLWIPIGGNSHSSSFLGFFEGNHKMISNLYVDYSGSGGLFSYIGNDDHTIAGIVQNVTLNNVNVSGVRNSGALIAHVLNGLVNNCNISSGIVVTTSNDDNAGGLVGEIDKGSITNCSSNVEVSLKAGINNITAAGGLVGWNIDAPISSSSSSGNVNGNGYYVGGLIGINYGNITACKSTSSVIVAYGGRAGGLIGKNGEGSSSKPVISSSYATGNVSGNVVYGGGLIGKNYNLTTITACYATGNVSSTSTSSSLSLGSIIGNNAGDVSFSASTNNMIVIGKNTGSINQVLNNCTNVFDDMKNPSNTNTANYNGNLQNVISLWKNEYWNTTNNCPKLIWE